MNTAEVNAALTAATDALSSHLSDAEDLLAALHLGVSAQVPCGADRVLRFCKEGKAWRLVIADPMSGETWLAVNASRAMRVHAAAVLHLLLQALYDAQAEQLERVQKAAQQAEQFVAFLRVRADAQGQQP